MRELIPDLLKIAERAGQAILEVYATEFDHTLKSDNSPLTLADKRAHDLIAQGLETLTPDIPLLSEEGKNIPYAERKEWKRFWLVDPLDGTKEFLKKNGEFTVNIALIGSDRPVLGIIHVPVKSLYYFGVPGWGAWRLETKALSPDDVLKKAEKLPLVGAAQKFTVIASRSHSTPETENYCVKLEKKHGAITRISAGSSLKFCLVAEGLAQSYPRFGPTMEWDTAAGEAIAVASGAQVFRAEDGKPMVYGKENLLNPFFIVERTTRGTGNGEWGSVPEAPLPSPLRGEG